MLYSVDITVPANTARLDRLKNILKVWKGVIHDFEIIFPPGCAGLVKCAIFHGGHQIIPVNDGSFLSGDTFPIKGRDFIDLKNETNNLFIHTYNEDDTYDHVVTVRLWVLDKKFLLPVGATEGVLASIKSIFEDGV